MPRRIDHTHAFGPRQLNRLALIFEDAWREVRSEIADEACDAEIEYTRAKLAQWIINYATIGKVDLAKVRELRSHALFGLRCSAELGPQANR